MDGVVALHPERIPGVVENGQCHPSLMVGRRAFAEHCRRHKHV